MDVTDVQVNLCGNSDDRLRAYCAVVFDNAFVVHNVRVIEKSDGLLVAMPSRKLTVKCSHCGFKNPVDHAYCGNCGSPIEDDEVNSRTQRDTKVHFDVAHPINPECRKMIEQAVLAAYARACQHESRSGE